MKIVRNNDYGGYGLSPLAVLEYAKLKGIVLFPYGDNGYNDDYSYRDYTKLTEEQAKGMRQYDVYYSTKYYGDTCTSEQINKTWFHCDDIERNDPILVEVVEKLGAKANGDFADLIVVEIPDDVDWEIDDYDGWESIVEKHRSW